MQWFVHHKWRLLLSGIAMFSIMIAMTAISNYRSTSTNTGSNNAVKLKHSSSQSWQNGQDSGRLSDKGAQPDGKHSGTAVNEGWGRGNSRTGGQQQSQAMPVNGGNNESDRAGNGNSSAANNTARVSLEVFTVLFALLSVVGLLLFYSKRPLWKMSFKENPKGMILLLLLIGILGRIAAATLMTGHHDIELFRTWAVNAANHFTTLYTGDSSIDYPPLYLYVLAVIGKLIQTAAASKYAYLLLKLPAILCDAATAYLLYRLSCRTLGQIKSLFVFLFYLFNPAILLNSTYWGQVDSIFTLLVTAALTLIALKKPSFSAVFFTLAVLMKPQGIIFLPILFFEGVNLRDPKIIIKGILYALATAAIVVLPFSLKNGLAWIPKLYTGTVNEYPYGSVNGYNLFSLLGANFKSDATMLGPLSYHSWGLLMIVIITSVCWFLYYKARKTSFSFGAGLMLISGVFAFSTGMHERYSYPAIALALFTYTMIKDKRFLWLAAGFTATVFFNTFTVLFNENAANGNITAMANASAAINIFLFICVVGSMWINIKQTAPQS